MCTVTEQLRDAGINIYKDTAGKYAEQQKYVKYYVENGRYCCINLAELEERKNYQTLVKAKDIGTYFSQDYLIEQNSTHSTESLHKSNTIFCPGFSAYSIDLR